jgi:hypothetical protein
MQTLPDLPEGSVERDNALTNLRNITRILLIEPVVNRHFV